MLTYSGFIFLMKKQSTYNDVATFQVTRMSLLCGLLNQSRSFVVISFDRIKENN